MRRGNRPTFDHHPWYIRVAIAVVILATFLAVVYLLSPPA